MRHIFDSREIKLGTMNVLDSQADKSESKRWDQNRRRGEKEGRVKKRGSGGVPSRFLPYNPLQSYQQLKGAKTSHFFHLKRQARFCFTHRVKHVTSMEIGVYTSVLQTTKHSLYQRNQVCRCTSQKCTSTAAKRCHSKSEQQRVLLTNTKGFKGKSHI